MQKHKDIYTLNRENPDAIIYLDSDGKIIRLTREDFSSEEEFRHWKAVSDQQYQQEKRQENTYRKRKVTLLDCDQAKETPESSLAFQFDLQERVTRKQAAEIAIKQIQRMLTATQYRRLWMYGMSQMNITHTRPTFTDSAQRMEQLRDLKKTCVRLVQAQREKQVVSA